MSNFEFLKSFEPKLYELGLKAESQYTNKEYKDAIHTLRIFTEGFISYATKKEGFPSRKNLSQRINYMYEEGYIDENIKNKLTMLKDTGNSASHFNKVEFDQQDVITRLQDAFFISRWLYNRCNHEKIRYDFDLTKLESKEEAIQEGVSTKKENSTDGMLKIVKVFFDMVAINAQSKEIVGDTAILEIKVDNRSIPYMVLLRKFTNDKVSNALYPAIYVYKGFNVAFTVYGKGGHCHDSWGEIEAKKPLIQSYFEEKGMVDQIIQKNPKFNYLDNHYESAYDLSELGKDIYQMIADDFENIRVTLKQIRGN